MCSEFYNAQFIPNGDSLAERPTTFHHPAGGVQLATPGRYRSGVADRSSPHFRSESQEFTGKKDCFSGRNRDLTRQKRFVHCDELDFANNWDLCPDLRKTSDLPRKCAANIFHRQKLGAIPSYKWLISMTICS